MDTWETQVWDQVLAVGRCTTVCNLYIYEIERTLLWRLWDSSTHPLLSLHFIFMTYYLFHVLFCETTSQHFAVQPCDVASWINEPCALYCKPVKEVKTSQKLVKCEIFCFIHFLALSIGRQVDGHVRGHILPCDFKILKFQAVTSCCYLRLHNGQRCLLWLQTLPEELCISGRPIGDLKCGYLLLCLTTGCKLPTNVLQCHYPLCSLKMYIICSLICLPVNLSAYRHAPLIIHPLL